MIHLLLGSSGSGKSYEATVFHILEAVKKGRKVITNLPLNLDKWALLDPAYPDLIELRKRPQIIRGTWQPTREEGAFNVHPEHLWKEPDTLARPFGGVWDYYTEWRHPETGQGPLFVVDEAQNCIPYKESSREVEEWVALHRHWYCDVLYLTQSYGKLSQSIRENVQMVYRFRKKVAWGQMDRYIRKVQDGLRGEVLNVTEREYQPQYFPLYRSHTQASGTGQEAMAEDIKPWWQHWSFIGAAVCLVIFVGIFTLTPASLNPMKNGIKTAQVKPVTVTETVERNGKLVSKTVKTADTTTQTVEPSAPVSPPEADHPYQGRGLHIVGTWNAGQKQKTLVAVSQNGQVVSQITGDELKLAGYTLDEVAPCSIKLHFGNWSKWMICDAPQVQVTPVGKDDKGERQEKPASKSTVVTSETSQSSS